MLSLSKEKLIDMVMRDFVCNMTYVLGQSEQIEKILTSYSKSIASHLKRYVSYKQKETEMKSGTIVDMSIPYEKSPHSGRKPKIENGNKITFGICPKCGGHRYVPAIGYVSSGFDEPIYCCLDCLYYHY